MAHLKAAQRHVQAASALISKCYVGNLQRESIEPLAVAVQDARLKTRMEYARILDACLKPIQRTP